VSEPIKINTDKYTSQGKVDIDGNIWDVKLPGAGSQLRFSQASRACKSLAARIELIDKKINQVTYTEEDLDKYDDYCKNYDANEKIVYDVFVNTFHDGTDTNQSVKTWIYDTPLPVIMLAFEDVQKQAEGKLDEPEASEESN